MKSLIISIFAIALTAGAALAQDDLSQQLPEGAMKPANLNALGSQMKDRMTDIVLGEEDIKGEDGPSSEGLSLFAGDDGEAADILEIKKIARELDTQRALMLQIASLQSDLISFAQDDPAAAYKSRLPTSVCEYAIEIRFCNAMTNSFQKRAIITREN
ncbi:hypothetical protein LCGC14_0112780 [marine sediment metagenome]|uniref:LTXXQ motif family protein n=2 Tax=root TaxID=1 RepID=A0A7V1FMM1_9RHOB|nr:hypothetical protein [Sulfitobacter litoralis]HDZ51454.1 hypothetical protein [Sulfitobacter litoralis]